MQFSYFVIYLSVIALLVIDFDKMIDSLCRHLWGLVLLFVSRLLLCNFPIILLLIEQIILIVF